MRDLQRQLLAGYLFAVSIRFSQSFIDLFRTGKYLNYNSFIWCIWRDYRKQKWQRM